MAEEMRKKKVRIIIGYRKVYLGRNKFGREVFRLEPIYQED